MKILKYIIVIIALLLLLACDDATSPKEMITAPSNFSLTMANWNTIELNWQDNTDEESMYRVDRRIGDGEWEIEYKILPENSITFTDSNLVDFDIYTYHLFALNEIESSNYTEATYALIHNDIATITSSLEGYNMIMPLDTIEVQFQLLDYNGDLVEPDYEVWFKLLHASEGTELNNIPLNPTDSISVLCKAGIVNLIITSGYDLEYIRIKAYTKNSQSIEISTEVQLSVGYENFIVTEIRPQNTNIIALDPLDSESIIFSLRNQFGRIISDDCNLDIELLERPDGTNINGVLYDAGDVQNLIVSPGYFSLNINSEAECGNVVIKLTTYTPIGEEVSLIYSNIVVRELVPYSCELTPDGVNDAENEGNGIWRLKLEAYLAGEYGYAIPDSTEVQFSLPDNPDFAYLENENVLVGDFEGANPGVVQNHIYFDGAYTNETVIVRVESGDFTQDFEVILPIQFPQISIESNEDDLDWTWEDGIETISFKIHQSDGQGNAINNQSLLFFTVLGEAVEMGSDDDNNINTEVTGYDEELGQAGIATKDYIFTMYECPPPNGNYPGRVDGILNIQVIGTNLQQDIEYTLFRY